MAPDWRQDAECGKSGPNDAIWFPEVNSRRVGRTVARMCGACPVSVECLQAAIVGAEVGVWGGTTSYSRAARRAGAA